MAAELGRALEETLGVRSSVVVLSRAQLAKVIADNSFPDEANPKHLHAVFRGAEAAAVEAAAVAAAERRARDRGGRDQAKVVGRPCPCVTRMGSDAASWPPSWPGPILSPETGRHRPQLGTVTKLLAMLDA
jgi:hypothetical protein